MRSKLTTLFTLSAVMCFTTVIANAQVTEQAEPATQQEVEVISLEIADHEDLKTLTAAIEAAELKGALEGEGPFTVFAPTDEAFKKVGAESLDDLLKKENREKLVAVLKAHVASGTWDLEKIKGVSEIPTVDGGSLTVKMEKDKLMVGDAEIDMDESIKCKNGMVHCIDAVLPPKE